MAGHAFSLVDSLTGAGGAANEDRLTAAPSGAWVIDGATGLGQKPFTPGPTDAAWFAEHVNLALRSLAEPTIEIGQILRAVVTETARAFAAATQGAVIPAIEQPSASLALARPRADGIVELATLGDCRILVGRRDGSVGVFGSSPVEELDRQIVAHLMELRRQAAMRHADAWPHLMEMIRANRAKRNVPNGYWALDLSQSPIEHTDIVHLPDADIACLLIVSDGFYRLVDHYQQFDPADLVKAAKTRGLASLYDLIRAIEADDPECERFPRIKARDDATAVLLT